MLHLGGRLREIKEAANMTAKQANFLWSNNRAVHPLLLKLKFIFLDVLTEGRSYSTTSFGIPLPAKSRKHRRALPAEWLNVNNLRGESLKVEQDKLAAAFSNRPGNTLRCTTYTTTATSGPRRVISFMVGV